MGLVIVSSSHDSATPGPRSRNRVPKLEGWGPWRCVWVDTKDQVEMPQMERSGTLIAIAFLSSLLGTLQVAFTEALREYHRCFVGEMVHSLAEPDFHTKSRRVWLRETRWSQGLVN